MTAPLLTDHLPDASRPLQVGRPVPFLEARIATEQLECSLARFAQTNRVPIDPTCRRTIEPGEHFLAHLSRDVDTLEPTGRTWSYCAPCAVRECHWWDVREVTS